MLPEFAKTHALSVAVHAGIAAALAFLVPAARRALVPVADTIELRVERVEAPPEPSRAPEPPSPPPAAEPPPPPPAERPARVPESARVAKVDRPRPFQERADPAAGARDAPEDTAAVPAPTTPLPELAMSSTVGDPAGEYVTTTSGAGTMPVRAGPGGGRGGAGAGRGSAGPLANQGTADVKASPDWEITRQPEPLNADDFEPAYPPMALKERREAVVVVRLHIDAEGRVLDAQVVERAGHGFDESALAYARRLRFAPARAGQRKVASRIEWSVHFYARD